MSEPQTHKKGKQKQPMMDHPVPYDGPESCPPHLRKQFEEEPWEPGTQSWTEGHGWIIVRQKDEGQEDRRVPARIVEVIDRESN